MGELRNFTRTIANTTTKQFENALDRAYIDVISGAFSPEYVVRREVKQLVAEGMKVIRYPSGHVDYLDVAIRRAVTTGVNQTCGALSLQHADEMGCDLVQVSSHIGARPEHAVWQGGIYSRSGKHHKYPDFVSSTGYGSGAGLCGWNCHHHFYPFFEGLSADTYARYDPKENEARYVQTQTQREHERRIRKSKRELAALDSAIKAAPNDTTRDALQADFTRAASTLKRRETALREFLRNTPLPRRQYREQVDGFGRSQSGKAVWANKRALRETQKSVIMSAEEEAAIARYVSADTDALVQEVTTGSGGYVWSSYMPLGDYYAVEKSVPAPYLLELRAPNGFEISEEKHPVTVTAGATIEITITNKRLPEEPSEPDRNATLKLLKVDAADSKTPLSGAVFGIYATEGGTKVGELLTDKAGAAAMTLPEGDYILRELEAPTGYELSSDSVSLHLKAGETRELTVKNTREDEPEKLGILELTKEDKDTGKALRGAVFAVYTKDNEKIDEVTTGADGTATLSLPVGRYILKEQRAPYGYKPEAARIRAGVLQNKTTLVEVTNELDPNAPPMPEINVPQTGIPFPTMSYAVAAVLFGIAVLCGAILIRSRKRTT